MRANNKWIKIITSAFDPLYYLKNINNGADSLNTVQNQTNASHVDSSMHLHAHAQARLQNECQTDWMTAENKLLTTSCEIDYLDRFVFRGAIKFRGRIFINMVLIAIDKYKRKILGYLCKNDQVLTYCCSECEVEFVSAQDLEDHMLKHERFSNKRHKVDEHKQDEDKQEEHVQEECKQDEHHDEDAMSDSDLPLSFLSDTDKERNLQIKYQVIDILLTNSMLSVWSKFAFFCMTADTMPRWTESVWPKWFSAFWIRYQWRKEFPSATWRN